MKRLRIFLSILLIITTAVCLSSAQNSRADKIDKTKLSAEERAVRFSYKKLYIYALAGHLSMYRVRKLKPNATEIGKTLSFELDNFQFGNIEQIKGVEFNKLVTPRFGDVIELSTGNTVVDDNIKKEKRHYFSVLAQWNKGNFASLVDSRMTLGELINYSPNEYIGYEAFASYDVTVNFQGKSRTYKALALFSRNGKQFPKFLDQVVAYGGILERIFNETRTPKGFEKFSRNSNQSNIKFSEGNDISIPVENKVEQYKGLNLFNNVNYNKNSQVCNFAEIAWALNCSCVGLSQNLGVIPIEWFAVDVAPDDPYCIPMPEPTPVSNTGGGGLCPGELSYSPVTAKVESNNKEHVTGQHSVYGETQTMCFTNQACQTFCEGNMYTPPRFSDEGDLEGWLGNLWVHNGNTSYSETQRNGPKGSGVSCEVGFGAAVSSCFVSCTVTASLSVSGAGAGASAQVNGGNVWNYAFATGRTCP